MRLLAHASVLKNFVPFPRCTEIEIANCECSSVRSRLLVIIYGVSSLPFIKTLITDVHTRACKELEYIHGENQPLFYQLPTLYPLSCRVQRYGGNVRTIQTSIYKVARFGYVGTPNLPPSVTLLVFGTLQPRGHVNHRKSRFTPRAPLFG